MPSFGVEEMDRFSLSLFGASSAEIVSSAPRTADEFAQHSIYAICRASVTPAVGQRAFERCMRALAFGSTTRLGFRHPGKAEAIDLIWRERERLYGEYLASPDKLAYLATLPWVGPVTKHSLARQLGLLAEHDHRAVA
jgi:hypothetical protein